MTQLARVSEEQVGDVTVAAVDGEIDASNAGEIGDRLRAALTNRSFALVIDLSDTTYVDSAGINLLFALATEMGQRQQQLHLVIPEGSPLARLAAITALDQAVPTHPTRAAAIAG